MPALIPTEFFAQITWLGCVINQDTGIQSQAVDKLECDFAGAKNEIHSGETRASCGRVLEQYPRGTKIRNVRQLCIVSEQELQQIANDMGLSSIKPEWLGATMVVSGIDDFSHIPPSSRLQNQTGATLVVDMQNRPCQFPAKEISKFDLSAAKKFKNSAIGKRGITAWVEAKGIFTLGDQLRLHIPDQRPWQGGNPIHS